MVMRDIRIGNGFDIHQLEISERPLIIGGVKIESEFSLKAHSDGDVLIHAVMDALLGSRGLRDIGQFFPNDSSQYRNADSLKLLLIVKDLVLVDGWMLNNIDISVVAEKPKLANHIDKMKKNLSTCLEITMDRVGIKATTAEKLGSLGRGEGIAVFASCLISKD